MIFKKKVNPDFLKENAPAIAFWVASIILVLFDLRVLDVVYQATNGSVLLAVGSLFATALMFFIWKTAFQYPDASVSQVRLAGVGMALALIATAVFGGMDYFVRGDLSIDAGAETFGAIDLIFWGIPTLSITHVVMLLAYWYIDPTVAAERKKRAADASYAFTQKELSHAQELLEKQTVIIDDYVRIASKYGKPAAIAHIEMLGMDTEAFDKIDLPTPVTPPAMTAPTPVPPPAMTAPVPVMAGANGHGKPANPTTAVS